MSTLSLHAQDTIAAPATAGGTAAIAVIRLSGSEAIRICDEVFATRKLKPVNLETKQPNTIHFGVIHDQGAVLDEVLVSLFKAPHSYTGENTVEISCHGSPYVQQQILQLLLRRKARLAKPGEFTLRAFLNGKLDLSQAEAVADLIASGSAASHELAMKQMRGGFSAEISHLREQLLNFASLIELELDFSEEDVEFANRDDLKQLVLRIHTVTRRLADSFALGNVIKNGVPVAIAGKPNAGKSTLLNALLNEERAIVSEIAGTTRDAIEDEISIGGISFRFIDTAGIRETTDTIESIGVSRTFEKIKQASIVIYLFDTRETSPEELGRSAEELRAGLAENQHLLLAGNKIDSLGPGEAEKKFASIPGILFLSAREKTHVSQLTARLLELVQARRAGDHETIVSNARHLEALDKTNESLMAVYSGLQSNVTGDFLAMDIRRALHYLGEITGEITTEDLLGNIFSKFCIGK